MKHVATMEMGNVKTNKANKDCWYYSNLGFLNTSAEPQPNVFGNMHFYAIVHTKEPNKH